MIDLDKLIRFEDFVRREGVVLSASPYWAEDEASGGGGDEGGEDGATKPEDYVGMVVARWEEMVQDRLRVNLDDDDRRTDVEVSNRSHLDVALRRAVAAGEVLSQSLDDFPTFLKFRDWVVVRWGFDLSEPTVRLTAVRRTRASDVREREEELRETSENGNPFADRDEGREVTTTARGSLADLLSVVRDILLTSLDLDPSLASVKLKPRREYVEHGYACYGFDAVSVGVCQRDHDLIEAALDYYKPSGEAREPMDGYDPTRKASYVSKFFDIPIDVPRPSASATMRFVESRTTEQRTNEALLRLAGWMRAARLPVAIQRPERDRLRAAGLLPPLPVDAATPTTGATG